MVIRTEQDQLLSNVSNTLSKGYGPNGAFFISDTDQHTADTNWYAILMVEDCVFATLTCSNWAGDTFTGVTFPAGVTVYGTFTVIDLTSGKCLAYFGDSDTDVTTA